MLDEHSLKLLKSRDRTFLTEVFADVNPYLLRVCASHGIVGEVAEEVIYSSWERFFSNLDKFEGRSQIRTFICGIVFNKIREMRRAQNKIVLEENPEDILDRSFTPEGWWRTEVENPLKTLEMHQASVFVRECLDGLSEQQKTAFVMKEVEEESSQDICNALGLSVSNLGVVLFRAREKLRKCLEGKI